MLAAPAFPSLEAFDIHPERGFLPASDPLPALPAAFFAWETAAAELPKTLVSGCVRRFLETLPPFPLNALGDEREWRRAMQLLSYLGQAYVWGEKEPSHRIPAVIAVPWHEIAMRLGRQPILSYASYALDNWRRLDPQGPIALGNIALIQNFLGGIDEEWFILIHVDIEAKAGAALRTMRPAQEAVFQHEPKALERELAQLRDALHAMYATLDRMPEYCDPYIYYHRVRPYIHGWKNNPALPEGVIYEGVAVYANKPQLFRGETGAQSSIIPALDALLGVAHQDDPLRTYLMEMRDYMPPGHRRFLDVIERGPSVRDYMAAHRAGPSPVIDAYNECVSWVQRFRALHLEYAASYIFKQSRPDPNNPHAVGTGGTPFMEYLKKHRDETSGHLLA